MNDSPTVAAAWNIEPAGEAGGICDCCGGETRRIWGNIVDGDDVQAVYFVTWTRQHLDHGARVDLILGSWCDGSTSFDRQHVLLEFRVIDDRPQFMICDADEAMALLAAQPRMRSQLVETAMADMAFQCVDTIWLKDPRLSELRGES